MLSIVDQEAGSQKSWFNIVMFRRTIGR